MSLKRALVLGLISVSTSAIGCARNSASPASAGNQATDEPRPASSSSVRSSDLITADELMTPAVRNGDALEAVRRLRPRFLNSRGRGSIRVAGAGALQVSLNGGPLQPLSFLARLRPDELASIQFLNSTDATQRFGTSAGTGSVLLVKNK